MNRVRGLGAGILRLVRPPNVFTAVADPLAGLALARGGEIAASDPGLWLLPASACLYLGGMALNDYFDREIDARERPERPIPAGAVPAPVAAAIGFALLAGGVACAAAGGAVAGGALLAITILAYDAALKDTLFGPFNMGLCRGLNFFLPMALANAESRLLAPPLLLILYITALTHLSRGEVGGSGLARARGGVAAMAAVGVALGATLVSWRATPLGWILFFAVLAPGGRLFAPLWADPSGPATGRAIGGGILLIPLFDATFVAAAGHSVWALAVAALALPAMALKRIYSPT